MPQAFRGGNFRYKIDSIQHSGYPADAYTITSQTHGLLGI